MKQYLSYSEYYLYKTDKTAYIDRYIKGIEKEPNDEMKLGKLIHRAIENKTFDIFKEIKETGLANPKTIRKLMDKVEKKRPVHSEVTLIASLPTNALDEPTIRLLSIFDGFDKENRELDEFKTGNEPLAFSQFRVDTNEQISFYSLVFWLTYHSYFKEIRLHFLDTIKGNIKTYKTVRSRRDIEDIAEKVNNVINKMKLEGLWEKRLSKEERNQINQKKLNL